MEFFTAVELFTQCITYLMIIAGFPSCINMLRTKVTKGVPYPFFLAGIVNSTLSIWYGSLINNSTIMQINLFATACNAFYIGAFIFVSNNKRQAFTQLFVCGSIVLGIYTYITRFVSPSSVMDTLGMIMLMVTTTLLLTPLLEVKQCIDDKSAAHLPTTLLVPGFLCSGSWFLYGTLLEDVYIYGPNMVGLFSYMCQVGVVVIYGTKPSKRTHKD